VKVITVIADEEEEEEEYLFFKFLTNERKQSQTGEREKNIERDEN